MVNQNTKEVAPVVPGNNPTEVLTAETQANTNRLGYTLPIAGEQEVGLFDGAIAGFGTASATNLGAFGPRIEPARVVYEPVAGVTNVSQASSVGFRAFGQTAPARSAFILPYDQNDPDAEINYSISDDDGKVMRMYTREFKPILRP